MLNRPGQTATWYRYVLSAGAVIALTAVGAAAMWTGWLPSRPLQWNDINGRLNLGDTGAAIRGDRPVVINQWPSAGSLGYQAKAEGLAFRSNAATFAERFARRDDHGDRDRGSASWGANLRSRLTATSGRSNLGGGMGGSGGGGLGSGAGIAQVPKQNSPSAPKVAKTSSPGRPSSSGRPGSSGGGAPVPVPPSTTVGDLATGTAAGTGSLDLGFGPGGSAIGGGGAGIAATPEPASIMLIGTGVLAAAGLVRRRRK
jgi:hypothetical protein